MLILPNKNQSINQSITEWMDVPKIEVQKSDATIKTMQIFFKFFHGSMSF